MKQSELNEVLRLHKLWLNDDPEGQKADLWNADLRNANLSYAELSYADLSYADLQKADLQNAELSYADLRKADLRSANLRNADLCYADLHGLLINKDNPSVFYQSENITILDTEIGMFYVFNDWNTNHIIKNNIDNLNYFKELIEVCSLNTHKFIL